MDEEQMEALIDAFKAVIDARLEQLGLISVGKAGKAPIKGKKGKPVDDDDDDTSDDDDDDAEDDDAEEDKKGKKGKKPAKPGKGKVPKQEHDADEVKEKLVELVKARDKQTAIDALSRFGCKKLSDLKEAQHDEFYEYMQELIDDEDKDPNDAEELFGK